jgi:hypothetical protein
MRVYYSAQTKFNGKVERMTKKQFSDKCKELEENGWTLHNYEPLLKKATYFKDGVYQYVK